MRYEAAWLLDCRHERGFTRPEDEPSEGDEGKCYVCPATNTPQGRVPPTRRYVRKTQ